MKYFAFAFLILAVIATAVSAQEATCSPWLGLCHQTSDCCRHLICSTYTAQCVPKGGIIAPGQDTRPLGPGPYAPGLPGQ